MTHTPVPPGWQLVPIEPPEEMLKAGGSRADDFMSERGPYPRIKAIYRAMLAAAPQPPAPAAVEGLNDLPGRLRDALARAEKAEAERDEARANLQIANTGGLNLLYDIRKAIGWTDKHALSLLPDECARLKKAGSRNASIWPDKNYDYSQPGKFDGPTGAD